MNPRLATIPSRPQPPAGEAVSDDVWQAGAAGSARVMFVAGRDCRAPLSTIGCSLLSLGQRPAGARRRWIWHRRSPGLCWGAAPLAYGHTAKP